MSAASTDPVRREPIRIAFIIDQLGIGGTERQLATLINGLDPLRFAPYLITIHTYEVCHDIRCKTFLFPTTRLLSPRAFSNMLRIARLLKRERIEIAQAFFFDANVVGVLAARLARVPVIISCRRDTGFWLTPLRRRLMYAMGSLADRILTNSETVRQSTAQQQAFPLDRIDTIYNGLDPTSFNGSMSSAEARAELGIDSGAPIVGMVSNLNREVKRLDVFIDAIPFVIREVPSARFIAIGKGHLRRSLEERCRKLGITQAITFAGERRNVSRLLKAFDVGVNSSDSEGLSNAVIEYMMAGIPAVVSDVPGNRELIVDGVEGYRFLPGNPASLAEKLVALLKAPVVARSMGERGREKAQKTFSSDAMIQAHMAYYERLISEKEDR